MCPTAKKKYSKIDGKKYQEATVIKPQQGQKVKEEGYHLIKMLCDDTDLLVLIFYYFWKERREKDVFLVPL